MVRNHAASSLRNRNRITNKSRLKIIEGNLLDDPIGQDDDDDRTRLERSWAGVDKDDVNEEHLQAVLSQATSRHTSGRATRGAVEKESAPAAYIPTPDSTGIVENYNDLYPSNQWTNPATFISTSNTVEETCLYTLSGGVAYYMDERDSEWLERNNEEARGEGTSMQGAVLGPTRSAARSMKARGKEPEAQPVQITPDELELVMAIFEKITHEKTEFLHYSLNGMGFPSFTQYHDIFANPLSFSLFESLEVPSWIPLPAQLLQIARIIYPYWKERRIERKGKGIIPSLNYDESDILNESFVCFRHREIKTVRKTRGAQILPSEKLAQLHSDLETPLLLAQRVLEREKLKAVTSMASQFVWQRRAEFVDLRRKFPSLGSKQDEELLVDKERPKKEIRSGGPKGTKEVNGVVRPAIPTEVAIRPSERTATLISQCENDIIRQKDRNHDWDDVTDYAYLTPLTVGTSRAFKYVSKRDRATNSRASSPVSDDDDQPFRNVRMRRGRGGRMMMDRRPTNTISRVPRKHRRLSSEGDDKDEEDLKLCSRWRFDDDEVVPQEDQDRVLVDDHNPKYLRHMMCLVNDQDMLTTDTTIFKTHPDGRVENVPGFKLGLAPVRHRPMPNGLQVSPHPSQNQMSKSPLASTPIAVSQQLKVLPFQQQMRISSNGGLHSNGIVNIAASNTAQHSPNPAAVTPVSQHSTPHNNNNNNNNNSVAHSSPPHPQIRRSMSNGVHHRQPTPMDGTQETEKSMVNGRASPGQKFLQRPKLSQDPAHLTNGYRPQGFVPSPQPHSAPIGNPPTALSLQQMQDLRNAFALQQMQDPVILQNARNLQYTLPSGDLANFNITTNGHINLKGQNRPIQWPSGTMQRPNSAMNGLAGNASPPSGRMGSPSIRPTFPNHLMSNGRIMSPNNHPQHNSSPIPLIAHSQSPPRISQIPIMPMASPIQQHQSVGNTQGGY